MKIISKFLQKNISSSSLSAITFITFILISLKWLITYSFFPNEPLVNKIIFELEDHTYFPLILNFSNLDLSPNYLLNFDTDKILGFPIYSLIFHSLTYLIFSEYSFIIIEYISFFFFILILYKIFTELNISDFYSILFALIVFLLPDFIYYFKTLGSNLIDLKVINNLYSFRIPRPIISSLYFFWGLLMAVYYHKYKLSNYILFLIGLCLGLNFGSFYYNFVVLSVLFIILFLIKIFIKKEKFFPSIKNSFIIFVSFLLISIPFIFILFSTDKDFLVRMGGFYPNFEAKKELIKYIVLNYLSVKFLLFFFLNSYLYFFLYKKQKQFCPEVITVIYLFFISTIISPILFIILSPTLAEVYHFINLIMYVGIFIFCIFAILSFSNVFKDYIKIFNFKKLFSKKNNFWIFLTIIALIYNLNYYYSYDKKNNLNLRNDLNYLYSFLDSKENSSNIENLLTFNTRIQTWWLYLGKNKLSSVHNFYTPLETIDLEKSFIKNLHFLKVSDENFYNMIKNQKSSWRFNNVYLQYFSYYKYQANSLVTYNNSKNFDEETLKFIEKSSPLLTMQIALPEEELNRLKINYEDLFDVDQKNFDNPDIIILEKNSMVSKFSTINLKDYCLLNKTKYINIYLNINKTSCN